MDRLSRSFLRVLLVNTGSTRGLVRDYFILAFLSTATAQHLGVAVTIIRTYFPVDRIARTC